MITAKRRTDMVRASSLEQRGCDRATLFALILCAEGSAAIAAPEFFVKLKIL
jgi:hypothetical protein